MDRGPVALFAAIVAVGLGPALWLGAQVSGIKSVPSRPPGVVSDRTTGPRHLLGGSGAGAGEKATGNDSVIRSTPRAHVRQLPNSPSARPSASGTPPTSAGGSVTPSISVEPSRSPSSDTPPTESTTTPTSEPSADDSTGPDVPPLPPPGPSSSHPNGDSDSIEKLT